MTPNRFLAIAAVCLILAWTATACCTAHPTPKPLVSSDRIEIQKILTKVQQALQATAPELKKSHLPPLESVTLTLQASAVEEQDGKIALWIISFGHSVQREATQELVLTLTPPDPEEQPLALPTPTLAAQLVEAILGAARGVDNANTRNLPLTLQTLDASVAFVVVKDMTGGRTFAIQPVTLSLGGDLKDRTVQQPRLLFKEKNKP